MMCRKRFSAIILYSLYGKKTLGGQKHTIFQISFLFENLLTCGAVQAVLGLTKSSELFTISDLQGSVASCSMANTKIEIE